MLGHHCGADQAADHENSLGFKINGTCNMGSLIGCQAGGHDHSGAYFSHSGTIIQLIGFTSWLITDQCIAIDGEGGVKILGGFLTSAVAGITVNHATASVFVDDVHFNDLSGTPINMIENNPNVFIGMNHYGDHVGNPVGGIGSIPMVDVASATTVTLPNIGDFFNITGTTNITGMTASWRGRRVTLVFEGILTFTDGNNLKLAGNLVTTADDTITLVSDGVNWNEISRSVN